MPADEAAPAAAAAALRAVLERQLAVLGRLAEAGLNIALSVERRATAAEAAEDDAAEAAPVAPPGASGDVALAYARVSRAVRLTVALQGRVVKELQALDEEAVRRRVRCEAEAGRERREAQAARKARVERIVERLIRAEAADEAEGERLADEAYERLEDDDIYGELTARPVSEIIARVCHDLGLAPDWTRLAEEAWAQDELAGGSVGAPLTAIRWLDPPGPEPSGDDPGALSSSPACGRGGPPGEHRAVEREGRGR
ncbi:hypothetical protein LJR219_000685 [Phenylobacterium sp. LjRoot219]|uniref:hypothetical protein n=1 Tax=Phenylobacterium sp. LjRoot219 TaxID=3342283 RepID=UPI003ECE6EC6